MSASSPAIAREVDESSLRYYGWRVVLAAHCGVMVSFGSLLVFTFSVFLKPLTLQFGWSREAVSGAFGFAAISVALTSPLLGRWLDRYGPRRIVIPCMAAYGLAFASLAWLGPGIWQLYATFAMLGLVGNGTTQMGYSRAVSTWFRQHRGLALSLIIAGVGVGAVVFPPLAQWLISGAGWRTAYAVLGGIILLLGLPLTAIFVRERSHSADGTGSAHTGVSLRAGLSSRAFWIIIAMLVLSSISINGAVTQLAALLTDRGVDARNAALAASALGGSSFAARLLAGWLLDRFPGSLVACLFMAVSAAGIVQLAVASRPLPGIIAAACIGLGLGGEAAFTPFLLTRYFGLRAFSTLYGITWTFYAVAAATGPILLGRAYDLTGSYTRLLVILAAATALAAFILLFLPRRPAIAPA